MKDTGARPESARRTTEKYRDVQAALADGSHAIGPEEPG